MANEKSAGKDDAPRLTASIEDQLREKSELERDADRERRAAEERARAAERHKQDEREVVARHGGGPDTFRAARREARRRPVRRRVGNEKLLFVGLGVLFLLRVVVGRVAAIVR